MVGRKIEGESVLVKVGISRGFLADVAIKAHGQRGEIPSLSKQRRDSAAISPQLPVDLRHTSHDSRRAGTRRIWALRNSSNRSKKTPDRRIIIVQKRDLDHGLDKSSCQKSRASRICLSCRTRTLNHVSSNHVSSRLELSAPITKGLALS
jgi:hypothetical protein